MNNFYDDHSGDDEVHPVEPEDMVSEGGPVYHDPTQPVEPVYPAPGDVDEPVNVDSDESFLDKVKRWITGDGY